MLMKNIKFISIVLIFLIFSFVSVFATVTSSNGYNTPIMDWSIEFRAVLEDGKVYTKWTKYNKNEWFKYYKVIRSSTVSNPVYPDNGYIKYSSDINFLSYIDEKVKEWVNYYRVCAITKEQNRYCSNVVKIIKGWEDTISSIPKECVSWYDGCNTCSVKDWKLGVCTRMACFTNNTPKCLKYKETEKTKICTMEYSPVCWQPPMPTCPKWVICKLKVPQPKTYSNKCMLEWAWAKFLYKWECKNTIIPMPIWGDKDSHGCYTSAGYTWCAAKNKCLRLWEETCNINLIPYKLRVKADLLVRKLVVKINKKKISSESKIKIINDIISRLEDLKDKKPKLWDLVDYIVNKLKMEIDNLWGDFWDIEDIFNIIK